MNRLAVFFPGIGYTVDKPLLYYSRKLAAAMGFEIRLLPYGGFPPKILQDRGRMKDSFQIALSQAQEMLAGTDFETYEDILFVGKSIGTVVAARLASECAVKERIRLVLYTPLEETFAFDFGDAVVFSGTDDPWVGREQSRIPTLSESRGYPCHLIEDANHSLETQDALRDIRSLRMIMEETGRFMGGL